MPELVNDKKAFSLLEVTQSIQRTLSKRYGGAFWVKAEMNKLNHYPHSGHCYPELVEKKDGKVIAQMRSNLWKGDYQRINQNFLQVLKEPLKDGVEILFCAKVSFSPNHGLSLNIIDIDPSFTMGVLEKEKFETIERLRKEGIYDRNKQLSLPLLPQRVAIISVQTSKGYADFRKVIEGNAWGYKFFCMLFPALLQGDQAVQSITRQLQRISKVHNHFDLVVIIRGGGGDIGLTCYNHYDLAKMVALFPIPVLTGIGHATNETVTEMISYQNAITPTELADFLLQKFHDFSVPVENARQGIVAFARRKLDEEHLQFQHTVKYFLGSTGNRLERDHRNLDHLSRAIVGQSGYAFRREREYLASLSRSIVRGTAIFRNTKAEAVKRIKETLERATLSILYRRGNEVHHLERSINNMHPKNVLKRGYSITFKNGKALKRSEGLDHGDKIQTQLYEGTVISIVNLTKGNSDE